MVAHFSDANFELYKQYAKASFLEIFEGRLSTSRDDIKPSITNLFLSPMSLCSAIRHGSQPSDADAAGMNDNTAAACCAERAVSLGRSGLALLVKYGCSGCAMRPGKPSDVSGRPAEVWHSAPTANIGVLQCITQHRPMSVYSPSLHGLSWAGPLDYGIDSDSRYDPDKHVIKPPACWILGTNPAGNEHNLPGHNVPDLMAADRMFPRIDRIGKKMSHSLGSIQIFDPNIGKS